jgi:hypothetical protein
MKERPGTTAWGSITGLASVCHPRIPEYISEFGAPNHLFF